MRLLRGTEKAIYKHNDLDELETKLKQHANKAARWVVSDGVFALQLHSGGPTEVRYRNIKLEVKE